MASCPQNLVQSCHWDASAHAGVSFPSTLIWEGREPGFPNLHMEGAGRNTSLKVLCDVLVHLGYSNRKPETTWLIRTRNLFLTVLEAVSSHGRKGEGINPI